MVSVMLFWGVGIAILGWLAFKIAERCEGTGGDGRSSGGQVRYVGCSMTRTDADQCRATGIWPVRPMTPFDPLPPPRPPRPSRARRVLEIAWGLIVALV